MKLKYLGISITVLVAAISFSTVRANTAPVCDTLDKCREIQTDLKAQLKTVNERIQEIAVQATNIGDIVKGENGSVLHLNQSDSDKYCQSHGTRLPTARELAVYAQFLGANGILETAYPGVIYTDANVATEIKQKENDRYSAIYSKNSANQITVDFYFNKRGYQAPPGGLGFYEIASSSVNPMDSHEAYELSGERGDLIFRDRIASTFSALDYMAVRCVR